MKKHVLLLFLDGVGIGEKNYEFNPFFRYGFKTFTSIFGAIPSSEEPVLSSNGFYLFPADAILGVEGLPQSGTGQTSIFAGVNAPQIINQHFGPYPYSTLIPVLKEKNIFKYYIDKKQKAFFVNAYPKIFFDYIKSGKTRLSVTSVCCILNGMPFNKAKDVHTGKALTAEITNERWRAKLNYKLPVISPQKAARRLIRITEDNDFTAYEYFLTDHLGHGRYVGSLPKTLNELDEFIFTLLTEFNRNNTTIVICSDHGNFENLEIKSHTLNPALVVSAGFGAESIKNNVKNISQIKDAITNL